ncbi:hypothetical protein B6F84_06140 [Acidianus manzaensis]|uniref:Uncharacterized protein n=2 Tax=Acidianus manzaensis TaxID=282676 RepID=A0A1W6JZH7_9CREN|nr:hypothetical protein B6F84_06140 [Acidianus manzaensis]
MSKYLLLMILVLTMPLAVLAIPAQPNYSSPQAIHQIPYFKTLKYIATVYNQTKVSNTTKIIVIANYTISYNVVNQSNGNILVNINTTPIHSPRNFTFNLIKSGNYTVNLEEDMLSLNYPYVFDKYLYNASIYELAFPKISIEMGYVNQTKVSINGINYTAFEYSNYSTIVSSEEHFYVLSNGLGYSFNTTYTTNTSDTTLTYTVNLHLIELSGEENSTLSTISTQFISNAEKPYQYTLYEYSSLSNTLQPVTYIQAYYPIIFSNGYLAGEEIELTFDSGAPVNQNFGFGLDIGNYTSIPLTFTYSNTSQIIWGGKIFHKVNTTTINIYGTNYMVNEYQNVSSSNIIKLYFSSDNNILVERAEGTINGNIVNITSELIYTQHVITPNSTYINYAHRVTTGTLPFSAVAPSESLIITIIITLVIVAIIILLYKR